MKLRTISQLPRLTEESRIPPESLMEVSVPVASEDEIHRHTSMSIQFGDLKENILESFEDNLKLEYGLIDGSGKSVSLSGTSKILDTVISGDLSFSGNKVIKGSIKYENPKNIDQLNGNDLVSKSQVTDLCRDYGNFLSPNTTYVNSDPDNTTPNTRFDSQHFMKWQFDQDGHDSEQFILDPYSNQRADPVFAKYSGNLVVYGWLADNGNVAAQEAWVGLFGKVNIGNVDSQVKKWVALQIQPWIIGTKSQALQYVGFNVPVKKNMQLKIMTGFPVNVRNSGFQDPSYNTLTLISNQPCTFVGYILRND